MSDGGQRVPRRDVLRLGGALALGSTVIAVTGRNSAASPARTTTVPAKTTTVPPASAVQEFRCYPDLHPAVVDVGTYRLGQAPGLILMNPYFGPGQQGPLIIDGKGEMVWFKAVSSAGSSMRAFNLRAESYLSRPVLTWFEGEVVLGHGEGQYVIADPSYSEVARVRAGNGYKGDLHEFFLTPQGTAFFTCYGASHADLSSLGGAAHAPYFYGVAQEVDIKTGKVLFEWRSDQHVAFSESYAPVPKDASTTWDYFHINSICLSGDGDLLISARHTWAVYKVSRATGRVLWRMGGKRSDFAFGPGAAYAWQHHVTQQPDGTITVFDNGAGVYATQKESRGLVLSLDTSARKVNLVRQYPHPGNSLLAGALGSVQVLPNGHVFIGWGVHAWYTEFGPDGTALLDGHLGGPAVQSYRAFRSAWTGRPAEPPAVAAERHGTGMTVFAAWNGATEVRRWSVLAGKHPSALEPVSGAPKSGFETAIPVGTASPYVAVEALDANGKQLGLSPAVRVP